MIFRIFIASLNLIVFGVLFAYMHFYELLGADPEYFDEGTKATLNFINQITKNFGIYVDPFSNPKISTLGYSYILGWLLISSGLAYLIADRESLDSVEVTEAAK